MLSWVRGSPNQGQGLNGQRLKGRVTSGRGVHISKNVTKGNPKVRRNRPR